MCYHRRGHPRATNRFDDRGVVALEFVLVAPFLFALIMTIAQFGIFFSQKVETESVARDAARTLALGGPSAPLTVPSGWSSSGVVRCPAGNTTSNATVTLSRSYTFSIPGIPLGTRTITATGKMRCGG
jgi:Flp pilus assembly protein TadG